MPKKQVSDNKMPINAASSSYESKKSKIMTNLAISAQERKHLLKKLEEQKLAGNQETPVLHKTLEGKQLDGHRGLMVVEKVNDAPVRTKKVANAMQPSIA